MDIITALNSTFPVLPLWCRTLSSSDDVQDRETEKGRLEEAFETCDRDLDQQIVQHYAELTTAIRTYQSITERITSSRNKIKQVEKGETSKRKCTVDKWRLWKWLQKLMLSLFLVDFKALTLSCVIKKQNIFTCFFIHLKGLLSQFLGFIFLLSETKRLT